MGRTGFIYGFPQEFEEILDAAELLDEDTQAKLSAILSRQLGEQGRERLAELVAQAQNQFATGQCSPAAAADLVREALS